MIGILCPFTQFPPRVAFCKSTTVLQSENRHWHIYWYYSDLHSFACTLTCMCVFSSVQFYFICRFVSIITVKLQNSCITHVSLLSLFQSHIHHPSHHPLSLTLATIHLVSISIIWSFQECYTNGTVQYVSFWDWHFFSLSIIPLQFIQIIICVHSLFHFTVELYSVVWINHSSFSHSRIVGYLDFSFLAFINKFPMNIHKQFLSKKSFYFSRFKTDL